MGCPSTCKHNDSYVTSFGTSKKDVTKCKKMKRKLSESERKYPYAPHWCPFDVDKDIPRTSCLDCGKLLVPPPKEGVLELCPACRRKWETQTRREERERQKELKRTEAVRHGQLTFDSLFDNNQNKGGVA